MSQLEDQIARLKVLKSRLEEQQAAETDHFAYDKPHGKVIAKRGRDGRHQISAGRTMSGPD